MAALPRWRLVDERSIVTTVNPAALSIDRLPWQASRGVVIEGTGYKEFRKRMENKSRFSITANGAFSHELGNNALKQQVEF